MPFELAGWHNYKTPGYFNLQKVLIACKNKDEKHNKIYNTVFGANICKFHCCPVLQSLLYTLCELCADHFTVISLIAGFADHISGEKKSDCKSNH